AWRRSMIVIGKPFKGSQQLSYRLERRMRDIRQAGSLGGEPHPTAAPLPLSQGWKKSMTLVPIACGSHHRQMVDERIRRLAQLSTAWRRWLPRGVGYALLAYSIPTLFRPRWIRYHEGGKTA
ncbi:MAG: hypothetical protein ACK5ZC_07015, partial [Pirellulaceae bacterium]